MRGLDYRCLKSQMPLVIANAFENTREAMQGLARVGRFGDVCKRIRFVDTQLVDTKAELRYTGKLFQCIMQFQKKPVQLKQIKVTAKALPPRGTMGKDSITFGGMTKLTQKRIGDLLGASGKQR